MKKIDCEFHYYLPEMMELLSKQITVPKYDPATKIMEMRQNVRANFSGITNAYPIIDELTDFGERRVAMLDRNGIDTAVMAASPLSEELSEKESVYFAKKSNDAVAELIRKYPGAFSEPRCCRRNMWMRRSRNWNAAERSWGSLTGIPIPTICTAIFTKKNICRFWPKRKNSAARFICIRRPPTMPI